MLVYPPCFTLIAMGIYNIEAMHANLRKMNVVCATIYAAILAIFGVGYSQSGNFHIGNWLYVMVFLFGVNLAYCHVMIIVEIRKRRKMLEEMAGNDILPYVRFARASVIILLLLIIAMPVAVLSSDFLYVIGPLELLALLFFIISFVSLGYNYNPAEELLDKDVEENYAVMENGQMETTQIETTQIETTETESTQTEIEQTESAQTEMVERLHPALKSRMWNRTRRKKLYNNSLLQHDRRSSARSWTPGAPAGATKTHRST